MPHKSAEEMRGRVWKKTIDKEALPEHEEKHVVISQRLRQGRTIIHVLSDGRPDGTFEAAEPDLRDVYFATLHGAGRRTGAGAESEGGREQAGANAWGR